MADLVRGDLLPRIKTPPPGPRSLRMSRDLANWEAPGVNTLYLGAPALLWQEAKGANVLDVDGNRYVDLTSGFGVAAVGHRHARVVAALRRQSGRLLHGLADVHAHPLRVRLAKRLAAIVPIPGCQIYFAVSGADAVEIAIKSAVLATGRFGILAFDPAYHGLTLGALAVTSRAEFREPFEEHLHAHVHRLPYGCPPESIADTLRRVGDIGCLIVEPVVGREGIVPPPAGWLAELSALSKQAGCVFVVDEIFTGFGRTGRWFAIDHEKVRPDLLCCGKALGGGLPIAATCGRSELLAAWERPGEALHTATFLAHPLSCAAALEVLDILKDEKLPGRAARLGKMIGRRTHSWPRRFVSVESVRGLGLLWGVELVSRSAAASLINEALQRGLLFLAGGPEERVVEIVPPLTISERQLGFVLDQLEALLE